MEHNTIESQECGGDQQVSQFSQGETAGKTDEFFSYAGLWCDRKISITTLRQQAWPRPSASENGKI